MSRGGQRPSVGTVARSADEVFERMFERLRREVPDVPPDPSQFDPALRLILKALAAELGEVYAAIDGASDRAFEALLRRLLMVPRGPKPAQTIVHVQCAETGIEIGPALGLGCSVRRPGPGGQPVDVALEFRPCGTFRLGEYGTVATIRLRGDGRASLERTPHPGQGSTPVVREWATRKPPRPLLFFCVEARVDRPADPQPWMFVDGPDESVRAVLWGRWTRIGEEATRDAPWTPARFVPPQVDRGIEEVLTFCAGGEIEAGPYAHRFLRLPLSPGAMAITPDLLVESGEELPPPQGRRWWWQVEPAGDPRLDTSGVRLHSDCVPFRNHHLHRETKIVPDLTRQAVNLPVRFDELADVDLVLDLATGVHYRRATRPEDEEAPQTYVLRLAEDNSRVAVFLRNPPRNQRTARVEVQYSTNLGAVANDVGPGTITTFLRPEPGIASAVNLTPTVGGRAARPLEGGEEEIRGALRHHGRAVSRQDYRDLTLSLGSPYVREVEVAPAVRLTARGVERCVEVRAHVSQEFVSALEQEAVRADIEHQLTARSPVGTPVRVLFVEVPR